MTEPPKAFAFTTNLPGSELGPNGRVHWRRLHKLKKAYERIVWADCKRALPPGWNKDARQYRLDLLALCAVHRGRDADNLIAAFKAGQDAMTLAGAWTNDSRVKIGDVEFLTVAGQKPCLTVTVTIEAGEFVHGQV